MTDSDDIKGEEVRYIELSFIGGARRAQWDRKVSQGEAEGLCRVVRLHRRYRQGGVQHGTFPSQSRGGGRISAKKL